MFQRDDTEPRWGPPSILFNELCSGGLFVGPAGTEALDSGSSRWLPVCGRCRDGPGHLRVGLCDAGSKPSPVRVAGQHSIRSGPPGWCGQTERTAEHLGELHDRYRQNRAHHRQSDWSRIPLWFHLLIIVSRMNGLQGSNFLLMETSVTFRVNNDWVIVRLLLYLLIMWTAFILS